MLTSRELKTFISVAEKMSIKLAAEELNITPPAVCSMIKKFENRINNRLFIFENNKMALTPYGERVYSLTKMHYHTLKAIELSMRSARKSIKIFLRDDLHFLSSFIANKFKIKGREVILTSIVDESTDLIINDIPLAEAETKDYNSFLSSVILYLIQASVPTCRDIFIHKSHAHLIENKLTDEVVSEIVKVMGGDYKISMLDDVSTIIDIVMSNLGSAILPNTCPAFRCLASSRLKFKIKRVGINIPMHVYVHKRADCEITHSFFDCAEY